MITLMPHSTMEYSKKMKLIEPASKESHMVHAPRPIIDEVARLDQAKANLLEDDTLSDTDKMATFNQLLQRYLLFQDRRVRARQRRMRTNWSDDDDDGDGANVTDIEEDVMESVQPRTREKARTIMHLIKANPHIINWNRHREFVHNGTVVPGSNIVELVEGLMQPHRKYKPIGFEPFTEAMLEINIPRKYIGNVSRATHPMERRSRRNMKGKGIPRIKWDKW